ncbi:RNA polymerase sigma factor [Pseudoclavibacter sp. VKM Ac-2888]|uniref:RNA polymerase sigma factor n=1 Tax=Pseudoclavibacter sp. VKM Ac-2888 TaxID=2783830 RepID=UPI002B275FF8|nr:RNA polymerase sigma factor [Pseudoclavibacter sp. VKM Ac-2888]
MSTAVIVDRARWSTTRGHARMADAPHSFDLHSAFRDHGSVLLGFTVNALRDRPLAEDCVQETFLRAWRARDSFDPTKGGERTWLFAIARNVISDALRARDRLPRSAASEASTASADLPAEIPDPLTGLGLTEALARLPDEQREAIVAIHLTGYSYAEFSARCGVPVATLRTRVFYGLRAVRGHLDEPGGARD